jgi:hypothetical protein
MWKISWQDHILSVAKDALGRIKNYLGVEFSYLKNVIFYLIKNMFWASFDFGFEH